MGYCLGIDVGTTSTAAAIVRDSTVEVVGLGSLSDSVPSILFVTRDFQLVVGDAAARQALTDPSAAARHFKRRLGDPVPLLVRGSPYSAEMLIAKMLSWVVQQVVEREGEEPEFVVASHPANWGPYKQELFGQALRLADLSRATTITEPAAAALFYAAQRRVPVGATLAVYDLGGGTFDAAVLRKTADGFELMGDSTGIEHLGGVDFDEAVLGHTMRALGQPLPPGADEDPAYLRPLYALRRAAVEAKELLSSESSAAIPVMLPGIDQTVRLTRSEFEDMIRDQVEATLRVTREAVDLAGVAPTDLDAVLLVGGSSRIPLVADMLRHEFAVPVTSDIDPVFAVARGNALQAAARREQARAAGPAASGSARPGGGPVAIGGTIAVHPGAGVAPAPAPPIGAHGAPLPPIPVARAAAPGATAVSPGGPGSPAPGGGRGSASGPPPVPPPAGGSRRGGDGDLVESVRLHDGGGGGRRRLGLVGGAVAVLAAVIVGALSLRGGDGSDDTATGDTAAPAESTTLLAAVTDPATFAAAGMTAIAGGDYSIGEPNPIFGELRQRQVALDPYYLDTYEVVVGDYRKFVVDEQADPPTGWNGTDAGAGVTDQHPVEGVSLEWAAAYCSALGKRLPSEIEFEVAARGPENLPYPWGKQRPGPEAPVNLPASGTYAIGDPAFAANVSGFGVHDLYGNAWEWVSPPTEPERAGYMMLRSPGKEGFGGTNGTRLWIDPTRSRLTAGFRCAASVDATVHPSGEFGTFERPPATPPPAESALQQGEIISTDFSDPGNIGFLRRSLPNGYSGWHPEPAELGNVASYHLDARGGSTDPVIALQGTQIPAALPVRVETQVRRFRQVETQGEGGEFWYGLVARAVVDPAAPGKATSYLAFVVNPESSQWRVYVHQADGSETTVATSTQAIPATARLRIDLSGDEYTFWIGNTQVLPRQPIPGLTGGGVGFILQLAPGAVEKHMHFELLRVANLAG